jgi:hypothetical protein
MPDVPIFPPPPDVPPTQRARGEVPLRYEDISQDGRVKLLALPQTIGAIVWQHALRPSAIVAAQHSGIVPILTRFVMEGGGGPVSVRKPLDAEGRYALFHTVSDKGEVNRLILNIWIDVAAPLGRTHGPPPARAGELVRVGRCFAEHVFTRPFGDEHHRKVLRFEYEGLPPVPPLRWTWRRPDEVLALPADARALDAELVADAAPCLFGLTHTDSNQHVNSLVYPRLFEEAALRRLAVHGHSLSLLASECEVAYRKPCFAGDRMRIVVRAFETRDGVAGAVGAFVSDADLAAKPHCMLRMLFS